MNSGVPPWPVCLLVGPGVLFWDKENLSAPELLPLLPQRMAPKREPARRGPGLRPQRVMEGPRGGFVCGVIAHPWRKATAGCYRSPRELAFPFGG